VGEVLGVLCLLLRKKVSNCTRSGCVESGVKKHFNFGEL
jgi:hypothetical protein